VSYYQQYNYFAVVKKGETLARDFDRKWRVKLNDELMNLSYNQ